MDYPFDLGLSEGHSLSIISFSDVPGDTVDTTIWLERGLVWYYAFNHEESIYCFKKALESNPQSPMACYGISLCHGPNYNTQKMTKADFPSGKAAFEYACKAKELSISVLRELSEVEVCLIDALQCRFNPVNDSSPDAIEANTMAYIPAMKAVYDRFAHLPCVACMYVEALMNTDPWKLWNLDTGVPTEYAALSQTVLQHALEQAPGHPGLCHFMIHLMEMSPSPESSLPCCDTLYRQRCCPDAGHLLHMPSHIYVLLGMYEDASDANVAAVVADEKWVKKEGICNYYTGYRIHNMHFVAYASMFAGKFAPAMNAAKAIKATLPADVLSNAVLAMYFEAFLSVEYHVLIRFGKWIDILEKDKPTNTELYPYSIAMHHYARGIALAVLGRVPEAVQEQDLFLSASAIVPIDRVMHNNTCVVLLKIGAAMLEGEILYRKGEFIPAFECLRDACRQSDALVYDEPWGWMQPPGHALAALMFEQGLVADAEDLYLKDMDRSNTGRCHPNNIWSLCGLALCYAARLGNDSIQTEEEEKVRAALVKVEHTLANLRAKSDVDVTVSCLCATSGQHSAVSKKCCT